MTQTSIHIPVRRFPIMDADLPPPIPFLPDLVVHHDEGVMVSGMEGELLWLDQEMKPLTEVKCPHPMRMRQASISQGQLIATWLDRELLVACMASMPVGTAEEGKKRSEIRTSIGTRTNHYPAGTTWAHALDAEPMALVSNEDSVVFDLYNRGMYKIGIGAEEHWRMPPSDWGYPKKRPRNEEVVALHLEENHFLITSKGGRVQRRSLETGQLVEEFLLEGVEAPLEHHFVHGGQHLACSATGRVTWSYNNEVKHHLQLSGPVQNATWDSKIEGWRIAGWREEVVISDRVVDRRATKELPVHICPVVRSALVLFNDGSWETSPF